MEGAKNRISSTDTDIYQKKSWVTMELQLEERRKSYDRRKMISDSLDTNEAHVFLPYLQVWDLTLTIQTEKLNRTFNQDCYEIHLFWGSCFQVTRRIRKLGKILLLQHISIQQNKLSLTFIKEIKNWKNWTAKNSIYL